MMDVRDSRCPSRSIAQGRSTGIMYSRVQVSESKTGQLSDKEISWELLIDSVQAGLVEDEALLVIQKGRAYAMARMEVLEALDAVEFPRGRQAGSRCMDAWRAI
jgi:hypothetical protein